MLYAEENYIARWHAAEWIRSIEGLPGVDEIKAGMFPVSVQSLSLPTGELCGLPYYAGYNTFLYNEEHLQKAGVTPPETWDQVLEVCRKLKKDGISDAPFHGMWQQQWPNMSWHMFACWYSEGAKVFDADGNFVDEPALRKILEVHQTLYKEKLVVEDIMTLPGEGVPSYASGPAHLHGCARLQPQGRQRPGRLQDRRQGPQRDHAGRDALDDGVDGRLSDGHEAGRRRARLEPAASSSAARRRTASITSSSGGRSSSASALATRQ